MLTPTLLLGLLVSCEHGHQPAVQGTAQLGHRRTLHQAAPLPTPPRLQVDGIEAVVEDWVQGLWPALRQFASSQGSKPGPEAASPAEQPVEHASGVPRAAPCRVRLEWLDQEAAARWVFCWLRDFMLGVR